MGDDGKNEMPRRTFLQTAATVTTAAAVVGLTTDIVNPESAEAAPVAEPSLQQLLTTNAGVRLVDQNKKPFNPATLAKKTTIVISGFHGCPACLKIKATLAEAIKQLKGSDYDVVVFNLFPERDIDEAAYPKQYTDIGIPKEKLHVLFTQTNQNGKWEADSTKANEIENALMKDTTRGHSTSIFVFDQKGQRMGGGTFAAVGTDRQATQAKEVAVKVLTSQRKGLSMLNAPIPETTGDKLRTLLGQTNERDGNQWGRS